VEANTSTKQLTNILAPMEESDHPQFVLVEGLPGIGKSTLLHEISYKWSTKQLIQKFKLVIFVQLCNPAVQQISILSDLLELCCHQDQTDANIITACSDYFLQNGGKDLLFLFDDFDQFPENQQKDSLIADILKRQMLPKCCLVVSSHPRASVKLRHEITIKLHILGVAEEERRLYIKELVKGHPEKVKELTEYLESHLIIKTLCRAPFIMAALLYLYEQDAPLPSNSADFYYRFVYLTIHHHLAKSGHPLTDDVTDFQDLPEPCNTAIKQLAKLSFKALNNNKVTFTLEEMRASCPEFTTIPGAINGFGLLHDLPQFGLTEEVLTFKFSHFFIQDLLSAYHIMQLPVRDKLIALQEKFWSSSHANMFSIYVALTKGQQSVFKQFLQCTNQQPSFLQAFKQFFSPSGAISDAVLSNQIKCLHLFHCFYEAGDEVMCQLIQDARCFSDKLISLEENSLSAYDVECVILFLISSPCKKWLKLNLTRCCIQDHGLYVIHRNLLHKDLAIQELHLCDNSLTSSSSSAISDLVIHCQVEVLWVCSNPTIGEDHSFYDMLSHPSSRLVELYMMATSLSSTATIALFTALAIGNKVRHLDISLGYINDEPCDAIVTSLKENTSLVVLKMTNNTFSAEAVQHVVQALYINNTLKELQVPYYPEDDEKLISSLQNEINKNREIRGCCTKLNISCKNYIS